MLLIFLFINWTQVDILYAYLWLCFEVKPIFVIFQKFCLHKIDFEFSIVQKLSSLINCAYNYNFSQNFLNSIFGKFLMPSSLVTSGVYWIDCNEQSMGHFCRCDKVQTSQNEWRFTELQKFKQANVWISYCIFTIFSQQKFAFAKKSIRMTIVVNKSFHW